MKPNRKKWIESKKRESDRIWYSQFKDIKIELKEKDGNFTTDIEFIMSLKTPNNRMACRVYA